MSCNSRNKSQRCIETNNWQLCVREKESLLTPRTAYPHLNLLIRISGNICWGLFFGWEIFAVQEAIFPTESSHIGWNVNKITLPDAERCRPWLWSETLECARAAHPAETQPGLIILEHGGVDSPGPVEKERRHILAVRVYITNGTLARFLEKLWEKETSNQHLIK